MFVLYQLDREMTGAWRKVVTTDSWRSVVSFIETYYPDYKGLPEREAKSLPVPSDYEASFRDVHGNTYVVYELQGHTYYPDYPDIDDDYNSDVRDYLRDKYEDDDIDYYGEKRYYEDHDYEDRIFVRRLGEIFARPDLIAKFYIPELLPIRRADTQNNWYVGALVWHSKYGLADVVEFEQY